MHNRVSVNGAPPVPPRPTGPYFPSGAASTHHPTPSPHSQPRSLPLPPAQILAGHEVTSRISHLTIGGSTEMDEQRQMLPTRTDGRVVIPAPQPRNLPPLPVPHPLTSASAPPPGNTPRPPDRTSIGTPLLAAPPPRASSGPISHLQHSNRPPSSYPSQPPTLTFLPNSMPTALSSHRLSFHSSVSSSSSRSQPPLVSPFPTIERLQAVKSSVDGMPDVDKLAWAEDVLRLVDRQCFPGTSPTELPSSASASAATNESTLPVPELPVELSELLLIAVPVVISITSHPSGRLSSTALFFRGKLLSNGACPEFLPKDQRQAFRDFEAAAKGGEGRAWFRLGRDYEGVGDLARARECFEKGTAKGDCECAYRMGMAHLLGQLHLSPDPAVALPLLKEAASRCNIDVPQPAYVYGMLLASELSTPTPISPTLIIPSNSMPSEALFAQHLSAREAIETAAHLGLVPAQYKCGYFYEHAALGSPYDPLMSVQWYSLASQAGDSDADMSLSKWFLCGAEGHFAKNEDLARTFAEKAARKGHPNGCFAMGYYYELGIGGRKDHEQAKKWYQRASKLDNDDAKARLNALNLANPQTLSLTDHQSKVNETLVRRHTAAKHRSDHSSIRRVGKLDGHKNVIVDAARVETAARAAAAATPHMTPRLGAHGGSVAVGQIFSPNPNTAVTNSGIQPNQYPQARPSMPSLPSMGSNGNLRASGSANGSFGLGVPGGTGPGHGHGQRSVSRPHIAIPDTTNGAAGGARRPSGGAQGMEGAVSPGNGAGGGQRGYTLTDPAVHSGSHGNGGMSTADSMASLNGGLGTGATPVKPKGPQTFADMGFVSKPVEEDGCVVM